MPMIVDESKMTPEQRRWWHFTKHVNSARQAIGDAQNAAARALCNGSANDVYGRLDHARSKLQLGAEEVEAAIAIVEELQNEETKDGT